MKVEVRPIERKNWHGKTGKESFTRPKVIRALVDSRTGQYATGLDYQTRTFADPDGSKTKLTEAEYYGKILKADLSAQFTGEPHEFWDTKQGEVTLENNTMILDTDIPREFIKIKIMKASKYIANSMHDYEEGLYPEATHVITDEAEEAESKASKIEQKNRAIIECSKLSKDKKVQLILVIEGKNLKGKSDNFVTVELDKIIEKKSDDILRYLDMDAEDLFLHSLVLEALQKNVFRKEGHKIMYYDSNLGADIYDVVEYIKATENQDLKLQVMATLNT